jgi:filamentous hemagglutinin family protein
MNFKLSPICNVPPGAGRLDLKPVMGWQFNLTGATGGRRRVARLLATVLVACQLSLVTSYEALANPAGMTVSSGLATVSQNGPQMTISTSPFAMLNWQSFNIAANETTIFNQPSIYSVVVNRINDQSPSQIYGSLQANGVVVLMNASGFYFGPNSFVHAGGGLIVSTANCIPPQNTGGSWEFNGPPPLSSIINFGKIDVGAGGSAYLIANNVFNYGSIDAPGGEVGLAAGQQVLLSQRPDGRGLSMQVNLPEGSVDNYGHITADAGTIAMNARTVNQDGMLQANSVRSENGVIELVASDSLNLGASSQITANGDASAGGSAGGSVTLQSGNTFSDTTGSQIDMTGGSQGGNGGNVEISAPNILSLNSIIDAGAQPGWTAGKLLLDPENIILDTSGFGSAGSGTVLVGSDPGGTLDLNVNTAFANLTVSDIILQAAQDITLANGTLWDLSGTIGANSGGVTSGQLTLEAGNNIIFQDGSAVVDENNWSVALVAGVNNFTTGAIHTGTGTIYLDGDDGVGGSIQTTSGSINLSAGSDIQIGSGTVSSSAGDITWQAGGDILFGDGSSISDGNNGVVTLDAGYNFANNTVQSGVGSIYLNGGPSGDGVGGSIQASAGDVNTSEAINLTAGQDITVGAGYVITTGGGSINAHALAGSIDTGFDAQGYQYLASAGSVGTAYNLINEGSISLGGISTAAGGDVTLMAGGNVTSVLPGNGGYYYDGNWVPAGNAPYYFTGGSGAYGSQPGNVTIVAGGNVTGDYLVANGIGKIFAGVEMDASGNPITDASGNYVLGASGSAGTDTTTEGLALNLISGGWNVAAAQNIFLQEVRNPNGDFNSNNGAYKHYFNYAPGDYVDLSAGNMVQLGASSSQLPRVSGANNNVPVIYPSILNISAGIGGVDLGAGDAPDSLTLFPSPQGSLTIDTTGSLFSELNVVGLADNPQLFNLVVSDAGHNQYTTTANFGINDHAATPVHENASTPISLNIGGDMDLVFLDVPEAAQISVGGNMNNCGFEGMNLAANDVTSINVNGDIFNQSAFTSVDLSQVSGAVAPLISDLSEAQPITVDGVSITSTTLATSFYYNPTTQILTYQYIPGVSLAGLLPKLEGLTIQTGIDSFGNPETTQVSILNGADAQALLAPYLAPPVDNAPGSSIGYTLGGGGQFDITARSMDLGTSAGIQSAGPTLYTVRGSHPLASLFGNGGVFDHGADINVTTTGNHSANGDLVGNSDPYVTSGDLVGDVDMFSSSIASLDGGNVSINAGGDVNAGSSVFTVNTSGTTGIYSTSQGDVTVIANGNINVNGSRITTYDGGNVTVESLDGNINAGTGASTPVGVTGNYEDPVTHILYSTSLQIPFSGITALTFPARSASYPAPPAVLGNILVEAPNGNVNANAAGILQIALNNLDYPDATTTVLAGYDLLDGMGNPVTAADLADGLPVFVSADRNINVSGSGIIAGNANLDASGDINGLIFARNNLNINAQQNINVTALGLGNVNVSSSGGTISGTLIGVGGVNASGSSIDASLISANVTGATAGQSGLGQGAAANSASQGLANNAATQAATSNQGADDEKKKKGKQIALAQKVSRVTVILPPKKMSETQTPNHPL